MVEQPACRRRASATSLASTASVLGHLVVDHVDPDAAVALEGVEHLEAAAAPTPAGGIGGVGDALELVEDEPGHEQVAP